MEDIKNCAIGFTKPLGMRVTGTGEFVTNFLCNLVQNCKDAEYDHEQELRQDAEQE